MDTGSDTQRRLARDSVRRLARECEQAFEDLALLMREEAAGRVPDAKRIEQMGPYPDWQTLLTCLATLLQVGLTRAREEDIPDEFVWSLVGMAFKLAVSQVNAP